MQLFGQMSRVVFSGFGVRVETSWHRLDQKSAISQNPNLNPKHPTTSGSDRNQTRQSETLNATLSFCVPGASTRNPKSETKDKAGSADADTFKLVNNAYEEGQKAPTQSDNRIEWHSILISTFSKIKLIQQWLMFWLGSESVWRLSFAPPGLSRMDT